MARRPSIVIVLLALLICHQTLTIVHGQMFYSTSILVGEFKEEEEETKPESSSSLSLSSFSSLSSSLSSSSSSSSLSSSSSPSSSLSYCQSIGEEEREGNEYCSEEYSGSDESIVHQVLELVQQVKSSYQALRSKGKFAIGSVLGYVAARLVFHVATRFLRIAGSYFVLTEVLRAFDVWEAELVSEEDLDILQSAKAYVWKQVGLIQSKMEDYFCCGKVRTVLKQWAVKDSFSAAGFAMGACVGWVW